MYEHINRLRNLHTKQSFAHYHDLITFVRSVYICLMFILSFVFDVPRVKVNCLSLPFVAAYIYTRICDPIQST